MRRALLLLGVLIACDRRQAKDAPPTVDAAPTIEALRDGARATLARHCGECHDPARGTALPRALAIFDVSEADWAKRMTVRQLREANRRLRSGDVPTRDETVGALPLKVSDEDLARFAEYVESELDRRGVCPRGKASCLGDTE